MKRNRFSLLLKCVIIPTVALIFASTAFADERTEKVLHRFYGEQGSNPLGNLIADGAGNLYGTTEFGGGDGFYGTVFRLAPPASPGKRWRLTTLYVFGNTGDGARPTDGLLLDSKGNLYGTTSDSDAGGHGEVFELSPPASGDGTWTETVLYHFQGKTDGTTPLGGLIFDENGDLYGTTETTVFELSPPGQQGEAWTFNLLHEFKSLTSDGFSAHDGLVRDQAGNLYGTTLWGGYQNNPDCGEIGCGTIFEVSPPTSAGGNWTEQVIHLFGIGDDGLNPEGGLTLDGNGNLYGTTYSGGTMVGGTAFQLTPPSQPGGGWTETVIHNFDYSSYDGGAPAATLIPDKTGNLYGTALFGGDRCFYNGAAFGCGVVFKLTPPDAQGSAWHESILYFFERTGRDARQPGSSLLFDNNGNLYGTSVGGGDYHTCPSNSEYGCGTVFEIVH